MSAVTAALGALMLHSGALAQDCVQKLGVHRTLDVSVHEGPIGRISYNRTLPLAPNEVVLTFDDGPMPRRTPAVLDALKAECARATFFVVGSMVAASPDLLRRVADEGHTVATHSWSHAYLNRVRSDQRRHDQINGGLLAASAALGAQSSALSPFFRFPGLGRTKTLDSYVEEQNLISMSADVVGDDWRSITPDQVLSRVMRRLEARGSGVILLHDIQPRTVAMLPQLLEKLREDGWKLVHLRPRAQETQTALNAAQRPKDRRMVAAIEILAVKMAKADAPATSDKATIGVSATPAAASGSDMFRVVVANASTPSFQSLGLRR